MSQIAVCYQSVSICVCVCVLTVIFWYNYQVCPYECPLKSTLKKKRRRRRRNKYINIYIYLQLLNVSLIDRMYYVFTYALHVLFVRSMAFWQWTSTLSFWNGCIVSSWNAHLEVRDCFSLIIIPHTYTYTHTHAYPARSPVIQFSIQLPSMSVQVGRWRGSCFRYFCFKPIPKP